MQLLNVDEADAISAQWRSSADARGCPANPAGPLYSSGPYAAAELRSGPEITTFIVNTTHSLWCCD